MNKELSTKLCNRFPLLFRGRYLSIRVNLMPFGIETGAGWYRLIYGACLGLEEEINKLYSPLYRKLYTLIKLFEHYWNKLMWKMPEALRKGPEHWHCARFLVHFPEIPMFTQIKEKYGTLRLYMSATSNEMDEYTDIAEHASQHTCEQCGKWGKLRGRGWLYTACDEHTRKEDLVEYDEVDDANS